jgi:hypothetical protein
MSDLYFWFLEFFALDWSEVDHLTRLPILMRVVLRLFTLSLHALMAKITTSIFYTYKLR